MFSLFLSGRFTQVLLYIFSRINQKYLDETIGKMRAMLDMDQMNDDDYKFIHYLLGRKELTQKDIVIICQSLFGDGLATVGFTGSK